MGGGKSPKPEKISATQTAQETAQAREQTDPRMAQLAFSILNNPEYGLVPTSQLYQKAFQTINPEATQAKGALYQNLLSQLQSPNYITPEEQAALDARRGQAQSELVRALNTQANLGGNLYGGINAQNVGRNVQELQNRFLTEDINLRQQNAMATKSLLLQLMGMTPEPGLVNPQYQSAAPDANAVYQGSINQAQEAARIQAQQQANRSALLQALLMGTGSAAGGYLSGGGTLGKAAYLSPGGYTPNTPAGVTNMGTWSRL